MVNNSQEPRVRDWEYERANLDSNERDFEPGRRADLRSGLLPNRSSKLPIESLHPSQALTLECARDVIRT